MIPQTRTSTARVATTNHDSRARIIELRKPKTRAECVAVPRPCPFATCRHNLTVDVARRGVRELPIVPGAPSCALDVIESGHVPSHAELGAWLGVEPATVATVESDAREAFTKRARKAGLEEFDRRDFE